MERLCTVQNRADTIQNSNLGLRWPLADRAARSAANFPHRYRGNPIPKSPETRIRESETSPQEGATAGPIPETAWSLTSGIGAAKFWEKRLQTREFRRSFLRGAGGNNAILDLIQQLLAEKNFSGIRIASPSSAAKCRVHSTRPKASRSKQFHSPLWFLSHSLRKLRFFRTVKLLNQVSPKAA